MDVKLDFSEIVMCYKDYGCVLIKPGSDNDIQCMKFEGKN